MKKYDKTYYERNGEKVKEKMKEYYLENKAGYAFRNINERCSERGWISHPAYTGCINSWDKEEFIIYYNQHSIREDIAYSIDKDSINRNNKAYNLYNCLVLPKQLNQMLFSSNRCNDSSKVYMSGKKYSLTMTINSREIYFSRQSTIEEHHQQKSIINSYKTLALFKFFYDQNTIDNYTYQKFLSGELAKKYTILASLISADHKKIIDNNIEKIKIILI